MSELTCIRCEKQMDNILDNFETKAGMDGWQPNDGLAFFTHGHYGTTYFDPMDGRSFLEICVCDACVKEAEELGRVRRACSSHDATPIEAAIMAERQRCLDVAEIEMKINLSDRIPAHLADQVLTAIRRG